MKNNQLTTIIMISLVVAVIASIATASITSNVIKINQNKRGNYKVYTTEEVDEKINSLSVGSLLKNNCRLVSQYGTEGIRSDTAAWCADGEFALYGGGVCYKSSIGSLVPNSHPFGFMVDGPLAVGTVVSGNPQGWETDCRSPDNSTLVIAQSNAICCK